MGTFPYNFSARREKYTQRTNQLNNKVNKDRQTIKIDRVVDLTIELQLNKATKPDLSPTMGDNKATGPAHCHNNEIRKFRSQLG